MSNLIGAALLVGFAAFAVTTALAGEYLAAFAFILAVVATLAELLRGNG